MARYCSFQLPTGAAAYRDMAPGAGDGNPAGFGIRFPSPRFSNYGSTAVRWFGKDGVNPDGNQWCVTGRIGPFAILLMTNRNVGGAVFSDRTRGPNPIPSGVVA